MNWAARNTSGTSIAQPIVLVIMFGPSDRTEGLQSISISPV